MADQPFRLARTVNSAAGTSIFFLASSACSCSSALGRRLELATAARINALQPQLAFEHPLLPPQSRATCWNLAASATATGLTLSFCCFLLLMQISFETLNRDSHGMDSQNHGQLGDGPNPQIAVLNLGQPLAAATASGVGTSIFFLASSACSCSSALGRRLELATAARINALQPQLAFEHPLLPPQSRATACIWLHLQQPLA